MPTIILPPQVFSLNLLIILINFLEFPLIKKKMVMGISPEVICRHGEMYSTVVRHNILVVQKRNNLFVGNVVFFVILLELSMVVLPPCFFVCSLNNFLTC